MLWWPLLLKDLIIKVAMNVLRTNFSLGQNTTEVTKCKPPAHLSIVYHDIPSFQKKKKSNFECAGWHGSFEKLIVSNSFLSVCVSIKRCRTVLDINSQYPQFPWMNWSFDAASYVSMKNHNVLLNSDMAYGFSLRNDTCTRCGDFYCSRT